MKRMSDGAQEKLAALACERVHLLAEIERRMDAHIKPMREQLKELDESMVEAVEEAESGQTHLPLGKGENKGEKSEG